MTHGERDAVTDVCCCPTLDSGLTPRSRSAMDFVGHSAVDVAQRDVVFAFIAFPSGLGVDGSRPCTQRSSGDDRRGKLQDLGEKRRITRIFPAPLRRIFANTAQPGRSRSVVARQGIVVEGPGLQTRRAKRREPVRDPRSRPSSRGGRSALRSALDG